MKTYIIVRKSNITRWQDVANSYTLEGAERWIQRQKEKDTENKYQYKIIEM